MGGFKGMNFFLEDCGYFMEVFEMYVFNIVLRLGFFYGINVFGSGIG